MSIKTMKLLRYFDLFLAVLNAYVGVSALMRSDYLWTAIGLGLSFLMFHNAGRRKKMIDVMEHNDKQNRDRFISGR